MKTTIIFDLDGLLINSEVISYQLYQDLLKEYGHSFTIEEYASDFSGKTGTANMELLVSRYKLPVSLEEGMNFTRARGESYYKKGVDLKPGARELLEYLKAHGYKILLASSSTRDRAIRILSQHQIETFFDDMAFGAEIEHGKPAPDIFLKAQEKAGEAAERCLVLEDSEAGIQAAHSAGIDVVCIPDMKRPGEAFCRVAAEMFGSLADVIGWLEKQRTAN